MTTTPTYVTDVAVIGAGPAGLFSVFECGMLKLSCHVIDALDMVGGQCSALYPEKPIYDIPAHPQIAAGDLIENLQAQIKPFNPTFHLGQQVQSVQKVGDRWSLTTSKGVSINAGAIIIAAGVGAFGPKRPPLEGIETFEGQSVFYFVKEKEQFRDKKIMIAGGGDSALDWVLSLVDVARHITVVHRRAKFRAAPDTVEKVHALAASSQIDLVTPYQLEGLKGEKGQLSHVIVKDLDGNAKDVEVDCLLPFYGLAMQLGPIAEWGLNLEKNHIAVSWPDCSTNHQGIYAVGDIATYPGKLKLILTGFAESAQVAHSIRALLHPGEVFHFEYSTTQGVPA